MRTHIAGLKTRAVVTWDKINKNGRPLALLSGETTCPPSTIYSDVLNCTNSWQFLSREVTAQSWTLIRPSNSFYYSSVAFNFLHKVLEYETSELTDVTTENFYFQTL